MFFAEGWAHPYYVITLITLLRFIGCLIFVPAHTPARQALMGLPVSWQRKHIFDDALALAGLVDGQSTVAAVLFQVRGIHIAAEVTAIDFSNLAFAADHSILQLAWPLSYAAP